MAIYCIGDIHGKFNRLIEQIETLKPNSHLLCVGDIGLGFEDSNSPDCLTKVNETAAAKNIRLWMIRGNHDNPYVFRAQYKEWNDSLSHIKLMADVDSIEIEGQHVMFVGGAISVDRQHEGRIDGISWWKEEPVHESCPSRIYRIVAGFRPADLIITHAGPITTLPVIDEFEPNIYHYSQFDPNLLTEINKERTLLSDCVQYSRAPMCVYGHYHVPLEYTNTGVDYRCVAELEVWEFIPRDAKHLPQAVISEEEKAKVETAPIRIKAPLVATPDLSTTTIASADTEDATTKELIKKTEELRKTTRVELRASSIPRVKTGLLGSPPVSVAPPTFQGQATQKHRSSELPVAQAPTKMKQTKPVSIKPIDFEQKEQTPLDKPKPKLPPIQKK